MFLIFDDIDAMLYKFLFLQKLVPVICSAQQIDEIEGMKRRSVGIQSQRNIDIDSFDVVLIVDFFDEIYQISFGDFYTICFAWTFVVFLPGLLHRQSKMVLSLIQIVFQFDFSTIIKILLGVIVSADV